MIRVNVELDQYGEGVNITKLAEVHIINDATGSAKRGNYIVRSLRKGTLQRVQRSGRVDNHPRTSQHVLTLLRKSLEAMGY